VHFRAGFATSARTALLLSFFAGCSASGATATGANGADEGGPGEGGGTSAASDEAGTSDDAASSESGREDSGASRPNPRDGGAPTGTDARADVGGPEGSSGGGGETGVARPCSAPGLLFCDDFESRPLGAAFTAPWSTIGVAGSSAITVDDSVPAHSGTHSVLTHPASDAFQTLLVYHDPVVLPVASARFYLRAQIRFGGPMSPQHNTFLIADLFSAPGGGMTARVGEDNQMLMMSVGGDAHSYLSNMSFYQNMLPGIQFPVGQWVCFEMMSDASNGSLDVWVDRQEVPDLHVTGLTHENYDALRFGFEKYAGPATDIWWDDIAVGTQPIGCD
jgi:hypothetical protein